MFGDSDSVFDFNPFEVGNWMTIAMMEEECENSGKKKKKKKKRKHHDDDDYDEDAEDGYLLY